MEARKIEQAAAIGHELWLSGVRDWNYIMAEAVLATHDEGLRGFVKPTDQKIYRRIYAAMIEGYTGNLLSGDPQVGGGMAAFDEVLSIIKGSPSEAPTPAPASVQPSTDDVVERMINAVDGCKCPQCKKGITAALAVAREGCHPWAEIERAIRDYCIECGWGETNIIVVLHNIRRRLSQPAEPTERVTVKLTREQKRAAWNEFRPMINAIGDISVQEAMDAIERSF